MKTKKKPDWEMRFFAMFAVFMILGQGLGFLGAALENKLLLFILTPVCAILGVIMAALGIKIRYRQING